MGYFDDIDFDDASKQKRKTKEELIEALLRNTEQTIAELDIDAIDDIINYLLDKTQYDRALKCVNYLLSYFPYSNEIWQRKAIIYDNLGDYEKAVECFDKAISLNPNDEETLVN